MGAVVPPQFVGTARVTALDGRSRPLADMLRSKVTALQTIFTGCSSVCSLQGAVFTQTQAMLSSHPSVQFVSVGIDPRGDTPDALRNWIIKTGGSLHNWRGAALDPQGWAALQRILDLRRQPPSSSSSAHSTQVFIFDREARLVWRTPPLPGPDELARLLLRQS